MREGYDFVKKRNHRLEAFFKLIDNSFSIIGNENTPAVIFNNKWVLSCYAHNFDLIFTDAPKGGNILFTYKLAHEQKLTAEDKEKILNWMALDIHRQCYAVQIKDTMLFLAGYNYIDRKINETVNNRYPVFAEFKYKLYFSVPAAEEAINRIYDDGFNQPIDLIIV